MTKKTDLKDFPWLNQQTVLLGGILHVQGERCFSTLSSITTSPLAFKTFLKLKQSLFSAIFSLSEELRNFTRLLRSLSFRFCIELLLLSLYIEKAEFRIGEESLKAKSPLAVLACCDSSGDTLACEDCKGDCCFWSIMERIRTWFPSDFFRLR